MGSPGVLVRLSGRLDVVASLERFRRWGDDLLERWDGETFVATAEAGSGQRRRVVAFAARPSGSIDAPALLISLEDGLASSEVARAVEAHVGALFVTAEAALARLSRIDPVVGALDARYPGLRPVLQRDVLTALVRSISAQQVNLTWAATTRRRLVAACGREHAVGGQRVWSLDAARLAAVPLEELRALQLTWRKAASIRACAEAALDGEIERSVLERLDDEAVIERLTALPGIGRWSAEWLLARTLGRPRVVAGDLGVRKAVGAAYLGWAPGRGSPPPEEAVRQATAHWGEAAGVAQQLLLHWLGDGLPRLGEDLPRLGDGLPRLGADLPPLGESSPQLTREGEPAASSPAPDR